MTIQFIDRSTGNIITEHPPGEGYLKFLYHNPFGRMALLPLVKRKWLSRYYGRQMDQPKSANRIAPFVAEYGIDMAEAVKKVDQFSSFNDFFYRQLKPEARPIADGVVSPADGKLLAFDDVTALQEYFVKGERFTTARFIADDMLAKRYEGGQIVIVRLAPNDYHRFHFPTAGIPAKAVEISGDYYSVSPHAVVPNFARVFCENKREYCLLATEKYGELLLAPVGATMVGAIIETYQPGTPVEKGDEMGYFAFGGSSILMMIPKGKVSLDTDLITNTKAGMETFVRMGERIGVAIR